MTARDNERVWSEGLQLERTSLAWRRLALALLGLSFAFPTLVWPVIGSWSLAPASAVAAGALILLSGTHRRYLRTHHLLTAGAGRPLPDGRLALVTVLSAMILAATALAFLVARVVG